MDRNALLAATRAEFLKSFLESIDSAMAMATVTVFRKADLSFSPTEQRTLLDAYRVLKDRQPELRIHFQRTMEQLLNRSFQTTYSTFRPSFSAEFSSSSLSLVDASQFEDQLRVDEITNRFRNAADQQLRDLNIRIALLFEQSTIKERENPFRPWLFTQCLATGAEALGVNTVLAQVVSEQIAEQLQEAVTVIYSRLNAFLAGHGIAAQLPLKANPRSEKVIADRRSETMPYAQPPRASNGGGGAFVNTGQHHAEPNSNEAAASARLDIDMATSAERMVDLMDRVRHMASSDGPHDSAQPGLSTPPKNHARQDGFAGDVVTAPDRSRSATPNAAPATWLTYRNLGSMMRRFLAGESALRTFGTAEPDGRIEPRFGSSVDRSVSHQLTQSIQALMERRGDAGAPDPSKPIRNLILEERAVLVGVTGDVSEQMTIDVVAMLFEFILRDNQIPAEVRAQLGRLQFLVLKIALRESTLLTQQGHPARTLVNRIGSISISVGQLDPSGTRINKEIVRIVEALLSGDTSSSSLFLTMLDEFDSFIANEFRVAEEHVERAVQVIKHAQSRTLRFTHISAQLDEALFGLSIDTFLRDFLMTTWTYVIERAERSNDEEALRFRRLVPDLLWTIVPRAATNNRTELLGLLPTIVKTIRDGLILIEWDLQRQQPILDWLVEAHRSVLRGVPGAVQPPTREALRQHFARFLSASSDETTTTLATGPSNALHQEIFLEQAIRDADASGAVHAIEENTSLPNGDSAGISEEVDRTVGSAAADTTLTVTEMTLPPEIAEPDPATLELLRTGVSVTLKLGGVPGKAQLTWIDQKKSTLVLSIEGQQAPVLISMRMFKRLFAAGRLSFLETAPLFERAVDSVQRSADMA